MKTASNIFLVLMKCSLLDSAKSISVDYNPKMAIDFENVYTLCKHGGFKEASRGILIR